MCVTHTHIRTHIPRIKVHRGASFARVNNLIVQKQILASATQFKNARPYVHHSIILCVLCGMWYVWSLIFPPLPLLSLHTTASFTSLSLSLSLSLCVCVYVCVCVCVCVRVC